MELTTEMWLIEFLGYLINHIENYSGGNKYLTFKYISANFNYRYPFSSSKLEFNQLRYLLKRIGKIIEDLTVDNENIPLIQSLVVGEKSKLPLLHERKGCNAVDETGCSIFWKQGTIYF